MNAVTYHEPFRFEPYRLPAGILAVAVHGVFFALLYFGFAWQTKPLEMIRVDLWQSLPEAVEAPVEKPRVAEVVRPAEPVKIDQPAQPVKVDHPDIALPEKKKVEPRRVEKKPVNKKADAKPVAQKPVEMDMDAQLAEQQAALEQAERAEQAAARGRVINEYKAKIQNKITINIVMPPGVPESALAIFKVTLLPGGSILSAEMKKSSGNAAYDNAVERAILKSDPLPLPPDAAMFKNFRVLELKFQPK